VLATAGCGSIDAQKTENLVQQEITRKTGARLKSVQCPDDVEIAKETSFVCTALGVDGTRALVPVTQIDDEGTVSFRAQLIAPRVVEAGLKRFAERAVRGGGTAAAKAVRCPELRPVRRNDVLLCSLTFDDGRTLVGVATQKDDQGTVEYALKQR
jgi:hypothetical protein